jgi:hypothetical protein
MGGRGLFAGKSWEFPSFWPKKAPMYGCFARNAGSGFLHSLNVQVDELRQNSICVKSIENYT